MASKIGLCDIYKKAGSVIERSEQLQEKHDRSCLLTSLCINKFCMLINDIHLYQMNKEILARICTFEQRKIIHSKYVKIFGFDYNLIGDE